MKRVYEPYPGAFDHILGPDMRDVETDMKQDINPEAVEQLALVVEKWPSTTARDTLRALSARLAEVEAERDRQYDENVDRIARQGAAEARAEAAEAKMAEALKACQIIDAVVKKDHDDLREMVLHFMDAIEPARQALAEAAEAERDALIKNNNLKADAIDRWINTSAAQHQEIEELKAKLDAQGRELNRVKYGEPDFSWSIHKAAMADLQAKLALAVEGLKECQDELDQYSQNEYPSDHPVHIRYRQRDYDANPARIALAQLTADTPPDHRIEGWNAAIEAAAEIYEEQFNRLSILIRAIPCPYHPKEKDDE